MEKPRLYLFDNLKAVMILLVVFGHALEGLIHDSDAAKLLYLLIYSFHIPLFAFCSGYFARFDVSRIKRTLIYPFVVFQALYLLFDRFYLKDAAAATLTKPYWLMWYLFALIVWEAVLPFVETKQPQKQLLLLGACFALGLLAGYDEQIGYYMSLSRILVYFPFFLMARYMRVNGWYEEVREFAVSSTARLLSLISAVGMTLWILARQSVYRVTWLYGSRSYEAAHYGAIDRLQYYLFAFLWMTFLFGLVPAKQTLLSRIGQNSLYVYLLHGFVIKLLEHAKFYARVPDTYKIPTALLLSVFLVFLFSRQCVARVCRPLVRLDARPETPSRHMPDERPKDS